MSRLYGKWLLKLCFCFVLLSACSNHSPDTKLDSIYIQTIIEEDKVVNLSPSGLSVKEDSIFFYDRKHNYLASGKLNERDTVTFAVEKLDSDFSFWLPEHGVREGIGFRKAYCYLKEGDRLTKLSIHVPDSQYYSEAAPLVYYGAQPHYLSDSLVAIPTIFQPKGKVLSKHWLNNAMRHGRLTILNLSDHKLHYPFTLGGQVDFNPMFEHPLVAIGANEVFYGLAYTNKIWTYDYLDKGPGSIEVESSGVNLDQFDKSKVKDREYRQSYYQGNSFATGLWYCDKSGMLVRRIKAVQDEKDPSGLKNPPYWADMQFEVVNPETGDLKRTLSLDGKTYSNRSAFLFKSAIYVKNEEESNDTILVFDGFELE